MKCNTIRLQLHHFAYGMGYSKINLQFLAQIYSSLFIALLDGHLLRRLPVAYEDSVYEPSGHDRPNPIEISDAFMDGKIGLRSYRGRTSLLVFFGSVTLYCVFFQIYKKCLKYNFQGFALLLLCLCIKLPHHVSPQQTTLAKNIKVNDISNDIMDGEDRIAQHASLRKFTTGRIFLKIFYGHRLMEWTGLRQYECSRVFNVLLAVEFHSLQCFKPSFQHLVLPGTWPISRSAGSGGDT